jgi:hypothetical protein
MSLLLADESVIDRLLSPQVLPILIPNVAIVGGIVFAITMAIIRHRERMARIERGMDPSGKDDPK